MAITARAQSAANVVRRLNAAVKSRRLYGDGHPLRAQTVTAFLQTVTPFHERYGSFVLETHRDGLILEGQPFEGGESVDSLALQLYSMGVWQLLMLPGLTETELNQLLDIVTMEPETILADGGLTGLLVKRRIDHVRVFELRPGEEDPANMTLETYHRLLDGTLSAQERAGLVAVLRAGPDQAMRLLSIVIERTKQTFPDASGTSLGTRVYAGLAALDRLIVDTPMGDSQEMLKSLAQAVTDVTDPQRVLIHRAILQRASQDLSARALLTAMTSEQIARMVIPCLEEGDPPPQLTQVMNGLPFDPHKARDALALVSQQTGRAIDLPPALEELRLPPWVRNIPQDLVDFTISDEAVSLAEEEIQALKDEATLDEAALLREHALATMHLALADDDPQELEATLGALASDAAAATKQGDLDLLGMIFRHLEPAARSGGPRADLVHGVLRKLLSTLTTAVSPKEVGAWPDDHPLVVSLRKAGRSAGADLAQAVASERDPARRATLAALLTRIGDSALDAIVPLLNDRNVDVARSVLPVLVHMRTAGALAALRTVARHPDVRVRKDAVLALGPAPGTDAQMALVAFARDPDPEVCAACLRNLRNETVRKAALELAGVLSERTMIRQPLLRMRVIDLLVQAGAKDALPAVQSLASRFKLRQRDRQVARHARQAARLLQLGTAAGSTPRGIGS